MVVETRVSGSPPPDPPGLSGAGVWIGIFLIGLGVILFLGQFRMFDWFPTEHLWPLILIALGAARLAFTRSNGRWSGFWILVAGIYCAIGEWRPFGLGWNEAWPIFVVAAGVTILLRSRRRAPPVIQG